MWWYTYRGDLADYYYCRDEFDRHWTRLLRMRTKVITPPTSVLWPSVVVGSLCSWAPGQFTSYIQVDSRSDIHSCLQRVDLEETISLQIKTKKLMSSNVEPCFVHGYTWLLLPSIGILRPGPWFQSRKLPLPSEAASSLYNRKQSNSVYSIVLSWPLTRQECSYALWF